MRIYTKVILQWDQDQEKYIEIESESYEYDGPMALCFGGDDDGLTGAQINTLKEQKRDVKGRMTDVNKYFQELRGMASDERNINKQSRIDDFLTQSYMMDKKADSDIAKGKGITNFETQFENQMNEDIRMDKFGQENERDKLDYAKGEIERNKAKFDQLASLEDMIYQIDTELQA